MRHALDGLPRLRHRFAARLAIAVCGELRPMRGASTRRQASRRRTNQSRAAPEREERGGIQTERPRQADAQAVDAIRLYAAKGAGELLMRERVVHFAEKGIIICGSQWRWRSLTLTSNSNAEAVTCKKCIQCIKDQRARRISKEAKRESIKAE